MAENHGFTIQLEQQKDFEYTVKFDWPDVPDLLLDEPENYFADPTDVVITPDGRDAFITGGGIDTVAVVERFTGQGRLPACHLDTGFCPAQVPPGFCVRIVITVGKIIRRALNTLVKQSRQGAGLFRCDMFIHERSREH